MIPRIEIVKVQNLIFLRILDNYCFSQDLLVTFKEENSKWVAYIDLYRFKGCIPTSKPHDKKETALQSLINWLSSSISLSDTITDWT